MSLPMIRWLLYWFVLLAFPCFGQPDLPGNNFVVYTTIDGLPGNVIRGIAADQDGFLWMATNEGLARYDGQRFMRFQDLAPRTDLPRGYVYSIFADRQGYLWLRFYDQGVYSIDLHTYRVTHHQQEFWSHDLDYWPTSVEDETGAVWLSVSSGVVSWNHAAKKFTHYPFPEYNGKQIIRICPGGDDSYFWAVTRSGIYRFDKRRKTFSRERALIGKDEKARTIFTDEAGHLWFSNWYDQQLSIVRYDPRRREILRSYNPASDPAIVNTDTWQMQVIGGKVWLATNSGGILMLDPSTDRFTTFLPDARNPAALQSEQVFAIHTDPGGNIWFGTTHGLHYLPAHRKEARLLAHHPYVANSLISPNATAAYRLDTNRLLLGTLAGLSIYHTADQTFHNIQLPFYNKQVYNNNINGFCAGSDNSFWVGTWEGLFRLDSSTGAILEYFITNASAGRGQPAAVRRTDVGGIGALHQDQHGVLWIADKDWLLYKMDLDDPARRIRAVERMIADDDAGNDLAYCFIEYDDRYFYIGTDNGLVRFDQTDRTFHLLPLSFDLGNRPAQINCLYRSATGRLLAIVNGQPYTIDVEKNVASPLLTVPAEQRFFRIVEDNSGGIWMNAENGLAYTEADGRNYTFFASRNYLQNNTFQLGEEFAIAKDEEGRLYFGGVKGFSVIDPRVMAYKAPAPEVKITTVKVNNQPLDLYASLYRRRAITLSYRQNSFSLEFSAIGSLIPALNRFAYRFGEGEWVDLGYQSTVNFSNLEPGAHHLEVKAANSDGIWSENGIPLTITIRPPWYRTWWAWLAYLALLGYGLYAYYQYQLRRRLEQTETLRLKELDSFKSRFFTNITHEFRTPLTVILGLSAQPLEDDQGAVKVLKDRLQLIRRNGENLLRLINQLLDLAQLNTNTLKLNYIQGDIVAYLNYVAESLYSFANAGNVRIKVESTEKEIVMDYEPEQLRQIIYNLLSNAVKFTPSGGMVILRLTVDGQRPVGSGQWAVGSRQLKGFTGAFHLDEVWGTEIGRAVGSNTPKKDVPTSSNWQPVTGNRQPATVITVSDTGTGIPPEDLPYIFDRFFQSKNQDVTTIKGSGVGLALTKELVKAMGGDIRVQSPTLPDGRGTTFVLTLPITNEAPPAQTDPAPLPTPATATFRRPLLASEAENTTADRPLLLIIEDNPDVLEYVASCLREEYQLDFAYNGRAGIEKAFELLPDIILSDVMMPEKSGLDVLQTLKRDERTSHIPIVLLTAKAGVYERVEGLRTGADAYLVKPFYPEELKVVLAKLIEGRRILQAKYAELVVPPSTEAPLPSPRWGETEPGSEKTTSLTPSADLENAFLQKFRTIVEQRLSDADLDMPQLERALGMSRVQIFRKVKALTGKAPTLFIRSIRLQHAKQLLLTTDLTVSEIAYDVGFTSLPYFSDAFLEEFKMRPTEVRK